MGLIVQVTPAPRRVTAAGVATEKDALEVLGVARLKLQLRLLDLETPDEPSFTVRMRHGMRLDQPELYTPASSMVTLTAAKTAADLVVEAPLRYLLWEVVLLTGASSALFEIDGVAWVG